ncbi:serine/threonine-protein kinase [Nonomuraea sediminis]|uniref:serine/threonine-protein kinase n=1 Tax=Nonomuraea sediminis TaxID=2835864 RepID=UPI001BDC7047|nr:serine/threonine-protein kinase [Nonomuraea sediminis]
MRLVPGDPERLGGYWLAGRLGAGAQGVVYDAYDADGRRFALKVLHAGIAGEVPESLSQLAPCCTVRVVEVRLDAAPPYVVSEFVNGPHLRQAVERHGPYRGEQLRALATGLAGALATLHGAGIAHRDLKPESVLLAADGPKVIDFGLATADPAGGTRTYLAPEVFTGLAGSTSADVFAWGAVVLYAATGADPFRGESLGTVMHRVLTVDPDLDALEEPLRSLVERALAKDPEQRPAAEELLDGLDMKEAAALAATLRPPDGLAGPPPLGAVAEDVYARLTPAEQRAVPDLLLDNRGDEATLARLLEEGLLVRHSHRVDPVETPLGKLVATRAEAVSPTSGALFLAWPRLRAWAADRRAERARRRARIRGLALAGLAAVTAIAVSVTALAVHGQRDLERQLAQANARAVAARAEAIRSSDPQAAMRLSVAAWKLSPVFEARAAVQHSLVQPELGVFSDPEPDARASYRLSGDTLTRWSVGSVTTWDLAAGRKPATHSLPAGTAAVSDDGRIAATADGRLVEVSTGQGVGAGRPAGEPALYAGGKVLTVSSDARTRLYAAADARPLVESTGRQVAVSPDGTRAALSALDGHVEVWDLRRGARIRTIHVEPVTTEDSGAPIVAFSPDGARIAVMGGRGITLSGEDGTQTIPDTSSEAPLFSPDGSLLALPVDGTVHLWRLADRHLLGTFPLRDPERGYAFSGDGRSLRYLSGHGSVVTLDLSGFHVATAVEAYSSTEAALSDDGRVAATEVDGAITLVDAAGRKPLGQIQAAGELAFDAAGKRLAVSGDPVTVWEVSTGKRLATIEAGGDVLSVALSRDGTKLATSRGRTLETWDVGKQRRIRAYEGPGDLAMAFSPDDRTLAVGSMLLDLNGGGLTPLGQRPPSALAFSPDGGTLAYGLSDGLVTLYDVTARAERGSFRPGSAPVAELRFSPDGQTLAVDGERIGLWDTASMREVGQARMDGHAVGLAFSQDGKRLRGVQSDGTINESPVDPALAAAEVCVRAGGPLSQSEWQRLIPESPYLPTC